MALTHKTPWGFLLEVLLKGGIGVIVVTLMVMCFFFPIAKRLADSDGMLPAQVSDQKPLILTLLTFAATIWVASWSTVALFETLLKNRPDA